MGIKHNPCSTCPQCGLDLSISHASHACLASNIETHTFDCGCVYCDLERQFAIWPEVLVDQNETRKRRLEGLLALWADVATEYATADFDRREELCEVRAYLQAGLVKFLDQRSERKFLQAICSSNPVIKAEFESVCRYLVWTDDFARAISLASS